MRIRNKELRAQRHRKDEHVKAVIKDLKAGKGAAAPKPEKPKAEPKAKAEPKPKAPAKPKAEGEEAKPKKAPKKAEDAPSE